MQGSDPDRSGWCRVWRSWRGDIDGPQRRGRARSAANVQQETLRDRPGANRPGGSVVQRTGRTPSGMEWQGAQSCQGVIELVFPGPTLWKMQSEAARRAGEPSGESEEAPPEGLGGCQLLAQTDGRRPASQVMRHHLDGQPGPLRQAQDWRGSGPRGDG